MKERGKLLMNTVVTTVMSNFGLYKAFDELGIDYAKTAVGDKYVYEYMMSNGCRLGGEQSGHIIFSKYASTGDGILTKALWKTTGFTLIPDELRAGYYSEIDIMVWAHKLYGEDFCNYLKAHYEPIDFVIRLAKETAIVLLNGDGFDGPLWSVRASLANLDEQSYLQIGTAIRKILDEYHAYYLCQK